jgi:thiamine kinase-like enzyme
MILIILLLNFLVIDCLATTTQKITPKKIMPDFDKKGYPSITTIQSLITAQYLQQHKGTIEIKQINGGAFSERLYVATTKKNGKKTPLLFFKISKKSDSTAKLIKIKEGTIGEKFQNLHDSKKNIAPASKKNVPHIIWLENIYTYKDLDGRKRTIEVTPAAQGLLVQDILESEDQDMINKAGHALGKNLAAFHQLFMNHDDPANPSSWKTICHGDFSIRNSLFDPNSNKIYFIDNEGMGQGSIDQDIKTILVSLLMFNYLKKRFSTRWPLYLEYCQSLLKGYVESYPKEQRKSLAACIEKGLDTELIKKLHTNFFNSKILSRTKFNEEEFKKIVYSYLHTI